MSSEVSKHTETIENVRSLLCWNRTMFTNIIMFAYVATENYSAMIVLL